MKKYLIAMLILTAAFSAVSADGFKIERAVINYKITGTDTDFIDNGTMEMAFDKFGQYMSTTMKSSELSTTTIITPDSQYMINWNEKIAMDLESFGEMGDMMDDDQFDMDIDEDEMGTPIGTETILGKKCTIYLDKDDDGQVKFWVWQGLPLKVVTEYEGMKTTMEATSVSTPSSIPASKFQVPKGIEIQKMPSFSFPMPNMN
ncbi:MAG: DUF4412 domain-containing protein [Spirochaetia bacterium]|jgi:hypothetical protein|nr:DUF4412 domain-containing protein [Spirochaetia bacterium]